MKRILKPIDPLGSMPPPETGAALPQFEDPALTDRADAARDAFGGIWIDNERQKAIIAQLRAYIGLWRRNRTGWKASGRRLSEEPQAGKSATMKRLAALLRQEAAASEAGSSGHEVVIVLLKRRTTLKGLYQQILKSMGDPHWEQKVTASTLLQRIEEHAPMIGMQLLVVDEAQHLDSETNDAKEILDQLKTFVDEGRFPMVFVGNQDSKEFFERNDQLSPRLGEALELKPLKPLSDDQDAFAFRAFCRAFDRALERSGAVPNASDLSKPPLLDGLLEVSGGHVGRVARLLEIAVPFSAWRGADRVEAYDLSHAVRAYALGTGWTKTDPFSTTSSA